MLEQLGVVPGMRVLEIGAGTGYNAALLAALVGPSGSVTSVDIDPVIVAEARTHLAAANISNVTVHVGDGRDGWAEGAPYDRILLTVGADDVWPSWREQLAEGGLLVLPLELANGQASIAFRRRGDLLTSESITPCGFMRLRGGDATGPSLVSLADGRRLAADRAAEIAEDVTALLRTRPRIVLGRRLDAGTLQRLGFTVALRRDDAAATAVSDSDQAVRARLVTLFPRNFNGRGRHLRYGVYASGADGPSLALYGSFLPLLFVFGGDAAERVIAAALADDARSYLPIERWRIEARPGSEVTIPTPPSAIRLTRAHCTLDLWPSGEGHVSA